jgi:ribosomal protein S18 acetylase RimI-like enzyme
MNIKIERLTGTNWELFKQMRLEAFRLEPVAFSTPIEEAEKYPDDYWSDMVKDSNNIILVAKVDDKPVGLMRAALKDEDVAEDTAFIGSAYVNKEYRGQGIAKLLMSKLIELICEHKEMKAIRLWVNEKQEAAIKLYKSFGFDKVGEEATRESKLMNNLERKSSYEVELIMEKRLDTN